jgi:hypothetical protein
MKSLLMEALQICEFDEMTREAISLKALRSIVFIFLALLMLDVNGYCSSYVCIFIEILFIR